MIDVDELIEILDEQPDDLMPVGLAHALYDIGYRLGGKDDSLSVVTALRNVIEPALFVNVTGHEQSCLIAGMLVGAGIS